MSRSRSSKKVALVLLSAGASRRMGQPKQLLPWKDSTLLQHALNQALKSKASEILLVLGCEHELIRSRTELGRAKLLINPGWEEGISSSIRLALEFIALKEMDVDGVMFCLSDQPLLDFEYYNDLINRFIVSSKKIIVSAYQKGLGVPAVFPASLFGSLKNIKGDQGAKSIIQDHPDMIISLDAEEMAVDLDTIEQYKRLYDIHNG